MQKAFLVIPIFLLVVHRSYKNLAYGGIYWIASSKGMLIFTWEKISLIFSIGSWSFFFSLWGKGGKGIWIFSEEEGKEEFLGGEEHAESEESFSWSSSFLEGDLGEEGLSEALRAQSVVSPNWLDGPVLE